MRFAVETMVVTNTLGQRLIDFPTVICWMEGEGVEGSAWAARSPSKGSRTTGHEDRLTTVCLQGISVKFHTATEYRFVAGVLRLDNSSKVSEPPLVAIRTRDGGLEAIFVGATVLRASNILWQHT